MKTRLRDIRTARRQSPKHAFPTVPDGDVAPWPEHDDDDCDDGFCSCADREIQPEEDIRQ